MKKYLESVRNAIDKYPQSLSSFIFTGALILPGAYLSIGSVLSEKYNDLDFLSGLTILSIGAFQGLISLQRYRIEKIQNKSKDKYHS